MHVAQFLHSLVLGPHVEIIKARLPDGHRLRSLSGIAPPAARHHRLCKALLYTLHRRRWGPDLRFTHQQVKVFGHEHVTQHHEAMLLADLFENLQEQIAAPVRAQPALSLMAAARDVMQMPGSVVTLKACWHAGMLRTNLFRGCDG